MNIEIKDNRSEIQKLHQSSDGLKHTLINKNLIISFDKSKKENKAISLSKLKMHKYESRHFTPQHRNKDDAFEFNKFVIKKIKLHNNSKKRSSSESKLRASIFNCFIAHIVNLKNVPSQCLTLLDFTYQ